MRHGGDVADSEFFPGSAGEDWLDLSTGINPDPWPVPANLAVEGWSRLPSGRDMERLLAAARDAYGLPSRAAIVAAPGTQALIQWLPRLAPPGPVAVIGPTYAEHLASWQSAGFSCREIGGLADLQPGTRHVVVVSPNNPDGRVAPARTLLDTAETCRRAGGWLIVDESFADLDPKASIAPLVGELPMIVLRSFGKFYGLPGLRLGFAIGPPEAVALIADALGPWAVSAPALIVGAGALADGGWASAMRLRLARECGELDDVLLNAGLEVTGGTELFRLVRHRHADLLHLHLQANAIWVRRFDNLPGMLRFGLPGNLARLARLREALASFVSPPGLGQNSRA